MYNIDKWTAFSWANKWLQKNQNFLYSKYSLEFQINITHNNSGLWYITISYCTYKNWRVLMVHSQSGCTAFSKSSPIHSSGVALKVESFIEYTAMSV